MRSDPAHKAHQLLLQHWHDLAVRSDRTGRPYFTDFLPQEDFLPAQKIAGANGVECVAFGGVADTMRVMLCFTPDVAMADPGHFPITCLTLRYRRGQTPEHRDILGALMGCNIQRDLVGDILIGEAMAQIFVCRHVAPVILQELCQVGCIGVAVSDDVPVMLSPQPNFIPLSGTVASLRADALVAFATRLSREKAAQLIRQGRLMCAHEAVEAPSASMQIGDVFSIRGYGKYRLDTVDGTTRKGRYHITILKYQ